MRNCRRCAALGSGGINVIPDADAGQKNDTRLVTEEGKPGAIGGRYVVLLKQLLHGVMMAVPEEGVTRCPGAPKKLSLYFIKIQMPVDK